MSCSNFFTAQRGLIRESDAETGCLLGAYILDEKTGHVHAIAANERYLVALYVGPVETNVRKDHRFDLCLSFLC